MITNKLTLFTAAAAMAQQVSGLSAHRHLHDALERRALNAEKRVAELEARQVVVTEWVTAVVTVHEGAPTDVAVPEEAHVVAVEDPPNQPEHVPEHVPASDQVQEPEQNEDDSEKDDSNNSGNGSGGSGSGSGSGSGGAPFSSKRGIAFNDPNLANTLGSSCESCSWGYNWASDREGFNSKYDFVPMLWGNKEGFFDTWQQIATEAIEQGAKALFSFNEPDRPFPQADMTPGKAAGFHQTHMNEFSGKALIGAPSISNSGEDGQGLSWLQQWLDACDGKCEFDFCNIHWYSGPAYSDTLFKQIEDAHKMCDGKPIWLTEFGLTDPYDPETDNFIKEVIPELEKIDYLHAYSFYKVEEGTLMKGGNLSPTGQTYASA